MNVDFFGKTVIVTGGAHGFGKAMCHAFAERGAAVWGCDLLEREMLETASTAPGICHGRTVDITDADAVNAFVDEVGHVDIVVSNAGGVGGQVGQVLEKVSNEDWQALFDINVSGAFYLARAAVPAMKRVKNGRIITISSGAGLGVSLTGIQAYASAKAALIGLTRQLAHELGAWGITVNSIAPGFVLSNPSTARQWQAFGEQKQQQVISNIALKRLGTPEDIAHMALFLASDYAGWISGQVLSVDGGK